MNKEQMQLINQYIPLFTQLQIEPSFLYVTATAYEKNIIDATIPFREFYVY